MFTAILGFLTSSSLLGNITKYILVIGGALLAGFIWLKVHDNSIRQAALTEFNQAQERIIEQQNQKFEQQTKQLNDMQQQLANQLKQQNDDVSNKIDAIGKNLDKIPSTVSGAILKETLKELRQEFGK